MRLNPRYICTTNFVVLFAASPKHLSKTMTSSSVMSNTRDLPAKGRALDGLRVPGGAQDAVLYAAHKREMKQGGRRRGGGRKLSGSPIGK